MQMTSQTKKAASYVMTDQSIVDYLQFECDRGASKDAVRVAKYVTRSLFEWLPEDKIITKDRLLAWRQELKDHGYAAKTELNYVKGINRYLDYMGFSDIRFNRGKARDLAGREFGFLTAIEPTGEKDRKDIVWRCRCRCGKEVEYPATRLLLGNTKSCGCLRGVPFMEANKYIAGTSIRQSMEEKIFSTNSSSGYTGVTAKRGKWFAYITYKSKQFSLGCYDNLEDAVKARARGKELVKKDVMELLEFYEEIHKNDPARPDPVKVRAENKHPKQEPPESAILPAIHRNNTSGHPGIYRKREKWGAKITYKKVTYHLGVYEEINSALAARLEAEAQLKKGPEQFLQWVQQRRKEVKKE